MRKALESREGYENGNGNGNDSDGNNMNTSKRRDSTSNTNGANNTNDTGGGWSAPHWMASDSKYPLLNNCTQVLVRKIMRQKLKIYIGMLLWWRTKIISNSSIWILHLTLGQIQMQIHPSKCNQQEFLNATFYQRKRYLHIHGNKQLSMMENVFENESEWMVRVFFYKINLFDSITSFELVTGSYTINIILTFSIVTSTQWNNFYLQSRKWK